MQFWGLNLLAVAALVLVAINFSFSQTNQRLRTQVAERQQFLNQSVRVSQLNAEVIKAIASLAAQKHDTELTELLREAGITYKATEPTTPMGDIQGEIQ